MPDTSPSRQIDLMLTPLAGRRVPGGCDDCAAYQTLSQHSPGVWQCTVHHDDSCPWYLAHTGNRAQRRAAKRRRQ